MLKNLLIKNFGLIEEVELAFHPNLNILTGATGAGKSIIIDGLRFALGERLRSAQIRVSQKPCIVEAVFELNDALIAEHEIFHDLVNTEDFLLVIYREAQTDGRTKIKVNGNTVTVAQLKVLGNHLVDFHGPHDHQMLLAQEQHLSMLDRLVDFGDLKERYREQFNTYVSLTLQLNDLQSMAFSREREMDLLTHQIKEFDQVSLDSQAYEDILQQQSRLQNTEKLAESAASLLHLFDNPDAGITENVRKAFSFCHVLTENDSSGKVLEEYLSNIQENSENLLIELRDYLDNLAFEPSQAEEINRQYDIYEDLKRKYGPTIEQAQEFYMAAKKKYDLLLNLEHSDSDLKKKINTVEKQLKTLSDQISGFRKTAAKILEITIEQELQDLGIKQVNFEVRFDDIPFDKDGADKVVFFISPNAGEDLKPLAEIVSSGEAARIMLALKRALIHVDPIPVLIFDEIDAQIGGRLGNITGRKLNELSGDRQVVLITHLPQIAVFGKKHFHVGKIVKKGKTYTEINELRDEGRLQEIAQMMGGGKYSEAAMDHARELLRKAR